MGHSWGHERLFQRYIFGGRIQGKKCLFGLKALLDIGQTARAVLISNEAVSKRQPHRCFYTKKSRTWHLNSKQGRLIFHFGQLALLSCRQSWMADLIQIAPPKLKWVWGSILISILCPGTVSLGLRIFSSCADNPLDISRRRIRMNISFGCIDFGVQFYDSAMKFK